MWGNESGTKCRHGVRVKTSFSEARCLQGFCFSHPSIQINSEKDLAPVNPEPSGKVSGFEEMTCRTCVKLEAGICEPATVRQGGCTAAGNIVKSGSREDDFYGKRFGPH